MDAVSGRTAATAIGARAGAAAGNVALGVYDVGGGGGVAPLYGAHASSASAIVFVLRVSDERLYSALWELYWLVQRAADPRMPVCVALLLEDATDGAG